MEKLQSKIDRLTKDLFVAQGGQKDANTKLKDVLARNEQLVSELKQLGEAVNALREDRELQETVSSRMVGQLRAFLDTK